MNSRKNKVLFIVFSIIMLTTSISGCGEAGTELQEFSGGQLEIAYDGQDEGANIPNFNPTGFPIVDESVTLTFMTARTAVQGDFKDMITFTEYEGKSGVKIDWLEVPVANLAEKRNLALASGDLPDAFYKMGIPLDEIPKYGGDGMFVKLNDLIEDYAPNVQRAFEIYPEVEEALTMMDGNIYSLSYIVDVDSPNMPNKLFINKEWVEKVNKEMPTTTDEFIDLLMSFKGIDFNKNEKEDEIPLSAHNIFDIRAGLRGAFGLGNRGSTNGFFDEEPNEPGKVRYWPAAENYKELLMYMNKMYTEGLIDEEIFTKQGADFVAQAAQGIVGSFLFANSSLAGQYEYQYEGAPVALKGPNGDQIFANILSRARDLGAFVITNVNEHPEVTMRWVDYFYGDEGSILYFYGVEGETYQASEDGKEYKYVDKIVNNPEGLTFDESVGQYVPWGGNGGPALATEKVFSGAAVNPISLDAAKKLKPFAVEPWPVFYYTREESEQRIALTQQLTEYVDRMTAEFIMGKTSFDQWDIYIMTLEQMGLNDLLAITQVAKDRQVGNE